MQALEKTSYRPQPQRKHAQQPKDTGTRLIKHTLKFSTFFTPGSIRTLRLYALSNFSNYNNTFSSGKARTHNKILIKQSYVILAWIDYISKNQDILSTSRGPNKDKKGTTSRTPGFRKPRYRKKKVSIPSLFIHPIKNYKTTIIKSPMAHKTFSQEQFMVRYYTLSLSFITIQGVSDYQILGSNVGSFNNNIYYVLSLVNTIPEVSTNMLFLSRYTLLISLGSLSSYFSYFKLQ